MNKNERNFAPGSQEVLSSQLNQIQSNQLNQINWIKSMGSNQLYQIIFIKSHKLILSK